MGLQTSLFSLPSLSFLPLAQLQMLRRGYLRALIPWAGLSTYRLDWMCSRYLWTCPSQSTADTKLCSAMGLQAKGREMAEALTTGGS
jgi:hypothetical protein